MLKGLAFDYSYDSSVFASFFEGLIGAAKDLGLRTKKSKWKFEKAKGAKDWLYVFSWRGSFLLKDHVKLPPRYAVALTEPLGARAILNKDQYTLLVRFLNGASEVWDYNTFKNADHYTNKRVLPLPLGYHRAWIGVPQRLRVPSYRVFFFGKSSRRRDALKAQIRGAYFGIVRNPKRDAIAIQSKIVLSVFAFEEDVVHNVDAFRILPLLAIGAFVIAERNDHPFYDEMEDQGLVCGTYDQLKDLCDEWSSDAKARERYERIRHLQAYARSTYATGRLLKATLKDRFFK